MPIDSGTLAGYDQLLSISQEAINRQLEVLYHTKVKNPIPNGPTHLINHQMNFHNMLVDEDGQTFLDDDGLDAYICCPKIEFGGQSISDPVDKYRDAIIRFKFRRAQPWEISDEEEDAGKQLDTVYTYQEKLRNRGKMTIQSSTVVLNDWEISWQTRIEKKEIQNVFEEIIKPAEATDSQVNINESVKKKLESVNSSNFQVATIFCAMQSARLVRSFSLVDENGKAPTTIKNTDGRDANMERIKNELVNLLTSKFTLGDTESSSSQPTPDNPFVLGYTVSQRKPDLKLVNPAAAKANIPTPAFFIPKSFHCNLSPKSTYSEGTLNYCMLTHRAMQPPNFTSTGHERTIDYGKDSVGRFSENVFARLKTHAKPGSAEGALFFCQDIFVNHWIGSSVAPLFYLSPGEVTTWIARLIETKYKHINISGAMKFDGELRQPTRELSQNNEYKMKNSLRSDRKIIAQNALNDPTESIKVEYDTTVEVKYENLYAIQDNDVDIKRRLKFTIGSYTFIKIKFFRRRVTSHLEKAAEDVAAKIVHTFGLGTAHVDKTSDDNWEEAYDANLWLNFKHTFEVGTSAENLGSFTVENSRSEHLYDNGAVKGHHGYPTDAQGRTLGVWKETVTHNWAHLFEFWFEDEKTNLSDIGDGVATDGAARFKGALDDLVKSLGTTVILPAGDVFMFKGMSADDQHNVFTTLTYNTQTSGSVKLQPAKNISLTGAWQTPIEPSDT